MSKAVISRLVNKYKTKGTVETEHLGGRPNKYTPHTDRKIIRYVKKNPFASARDKIRKLKLDISENIVRRRLDDAGLYNYRATKNHSYWQRTEQERAATVLKNRTVEQWRRILW